MVAAGRNWEWGRAKSSGDAPTPAAQAFGSGQELKLGVLLLNLGGPERPEDVQPFLYNLFADPDIIRLPRLVRWLQSPIASVLSARRYAAVSDPACCGVFFERSRVIGFAMGRVHNNRWKFASAFVRFCRKPPF